jgi:hypothetical protein
MPLGRTELLPFGLAMDLSYAATPAAGNCVGVTWLAASVGKSRAGVLSQAGAPLSWTSERADTLFRLRSE